MRANRRRDTAPEVAVRRRLHAKGMRFRVDFRVDPAYRLRLDIVFTRQRVAIFIDGCFWHRCRVHSTQPRANAECWALKLTRKCAARQTDSILRESGWVVLRFWEHEDVEHVVAKIEEEVVRRRKAD